MNDSYFLRMNSGKVEVWQVGEGYSYRLSSHDSVDEALGYASTLVTYPLVIPLLRAP